jgi:hypothetical protein
MELWKIIPEKASEFSVEIEDPEGWYSARVKWDGCVDYYRYYNTPKGVDVENDDTMEDYMHFCCIDEEITRLQALKRIAYNYFETSGRADHYWNADVVDASIPAPLQLPQKDRVNHES